MVKGYLTCANRIFNTQYPMMVGTLLLDNTFQKIILALRLSNHYLHLNLIKYIKVVPKKIMGEK